MDAQEQHLCLLKMPALVLDKILANIPNPSNVSRTCKYLYEFVCDMEKLRRVMYIGAFDATSRLNIDDDAVFDSIMNSHRTITEIELRLERFMAGSVELNERQLDQMNSILKQFGANVTSLKFEGFALPISLIFELLQRAAKLESLSFAHGKVVGLITAYTTMPLQVLTLKSLKIHHFTGLSDIINLIPAGSLNSYSSSIGSHQSTELTFLHPTILTKQHNIKCLSLEACSNSDLTNLSGHHLQLDTLIFKSYGFSDNLQIKEMLKCQTNLRELRFISHDDLSAGLFQWICNNLKKLEVFEVDRLDSIEGDALKMVGELKRLRHFRTYDGRLLFDNGFQSFPFKSESIEKLEIGPDAEIGSDNIMNSMARNLPNLTYLKMKFENFNELSLVLQHCTKIIDLTTCIYDPIPHQLTQQRFQSVQSLELSNNRSLVDTNYEMMSKCMTSIVRAMPNLRSMLLSGDGVIKFDVNTMKEFVKESKSLDYFYVDWFELSRELSEDDVVDTIRCLTDQLKGYHINFTSSTENLNCHKIRDILSNEFYVRDRDWSWRRASFYLHRGVVKKFHNSLFT